MVGRRFGLDEGAAFVSGDGINKPRGFMSYNFIDDASWAWGSVGFVPSGDASGFPAATSTVSPADALFDLIYSLTPEYRANAAFFMNDATLATVSKFKTASTGELIWRPSLVAGQPSSLLGYPVISTPDMPDIEANKFPIVFGDMKEFYTISDAAPTSILVDPYSTKPYVLYYARKRVAGAITNFAAAKALKIAS
jgi:HK97 family phage major capsid protein